MLNWRRQPCAWILGALSAGLVPPWTGIALAQIPGAAAAATGAYDLHVSPGGDDAHPGSDWRAPLKSIQRALELARPGQRIAIHAGEYFEDLRTVRGGREGAPIQLVAAAGAVLRGAGASRVFEIRHSHVEILNLQVDGEVKGAGGAPAYRDKLVYIMGQDARAGIRGVRLLNMRLRNAAGECVRMKYFAHQNELAWSQVFRCGIRDFELGGGGKNGEGLYIGTAPEQLDRNPSPDLDASNGNWVHHNLFDTRGNECVDIKEGARFNVVEFNECTGQRDEKAAGLSARGNDNIIRFNRVFGNRGAGIRLGGDTPQDGTGNHVYGNLLAANAFAAFKIMAMPQAEVCGNTVEPGSAALVRGTFAKQHAPTEACR